MKYLALLLSSALLASSKLIVDFKGGDSPSKLGNVELEGQNLGCKIDDGKGGKAVFIKNAPDSSNKKPALHFHRDPHFRRAEVKAMAKGEDQAKEDKTYYIGYHFRLEKSRDGLVIFQWKKWNKEVAPKQNIPLYVHFNKDLDLVIEYTTPGKNGSDREIVWTGPVSAGAGTEHKMGFIINTKNDGKGWAEFYLDGEKQKWKGGDTRLKDVYLFTGETSPKFGIYRAEASGGEGDKYCPSSESYSGEAAPSGTERVYNLWVYRVQISDEGMDEAKEAAGWE